MCTTEVALHWPAPQSFQAAHGLPLATREIILKRFYSRSTGATYLEGLHTSIPEDAIFLSDDRYDQIICNPDPSKVRSHDDQGFPVLVDRPPLSQEESAAIERAWRDGQLYETQWLVARYNEECSLQLTTSNTPEQYSGLLEYRQSLRDWPGAGGFPDSEQRPQAPIWIADETQ